MVQSRSVPLFPEQLLQPRHVNLLSSCAAARRSQVKWLAFPMDFFGQRVDFLHTSFPPCLVTGLNSNLSLCACSPTLSLTNHLSCSLGFHPPMLSLSLHPPFPPFCHCALTQVAPDRGTLFCLHQGFFWCWARGMHTLHVSKGRPHTGVRSDSTLLHHQFSSVWAWRTRLSKDDHPPSLFGVPSSVCLSVDTGGVSARAEC